MNITLSYKACMLLRKLGYNEWSDNLYTTLITHNGEYIDEDEEFELKAQKRGKEIKRQRGGCIIRMSNRNYNDYICKYNCSAVDFSEFCEWMMYKKHVFIAINVDSKSAKPLSLAFYEIDKMGGLSPYNFKAKNFTLHEAKDAIDKEVMRFLKKFDDNRKV